MGSYMYVCVCVCVCGILYIIHVWVKRGCTWSCVHVTCDGLV